MMSPVCSFEKFLLYVAARLALREYYEKLAAN